MGSQEKAFATQIDDASLARALVLRDSFTTYLTAPLSEHFRFCEYQWTNDFHPQEILEEKPDVLIDEIAERHLYEEFHEHMPRTTSLATKGVPICSYGNKIELMGLAATKNYKGTILELRWRSKQPIKLDYMLFKQQDSCMEG
jgi:hypothetical protein